MHWFYHTVRHVLSSWGDWALLLGLFGEWVIGYLFRRQEKHRFASREQQKAA